MGEQGYPEGTKFIIIEMQKDAQGNIAVVTPVTYGNQNQADNKFFTVLASAAVSNVPKHTVVMLHEDGFIVRSESYIHNAE